MPRCRTAACGSMHCWLHNSQFPIAFCYLPAVRERLTRFIPAAFYGCFYCVVTCVSLLLMFAAWQPHPTVIWQVWASAARRLSVAVSRLRGGRCSTACT